MPSESDECGCEQCRGPEAPAWVRALMAGAAAGAGEPLPAH